MWDRSWKVRKWREWSSEQSATISWLTDSPSSRSCRSMLSMRKPDCSTAWRYTGGFLEWTRRKSEEMQAILRDTDFVCKERSSGAREEKEWYHPQRIGEGEGDKDGGVVRNAEGTLWLEMNQGKDEIDRNPVHFLWHSHGECSPAFSEGSRRNCSDCLMFYMWNGFIGVLSPVVAENEKIGFQMKPVI